jgi:hypothetical protein
MADDRNRLMASRRRLHFRPTKRSRLRLAVKRIIPKSFFDDALVLLCTNLASVDFKSVSNRLLGVCLQHQFGGFSTCHADGDSNRLGFGCGTDDLGIE